MKHLVKTILCVRLMIFYLVISLFAYNVSAQDQGINRLVQVDSYRLFSDKGFSFEYRLIEGSDVSVMDVYIKNSDRSSVLSVYKAPASLAGRKIFMDGTTFWMLDKKMRDPIRISSRQMLFGQASAGDITRLSFSDAYTIVSETIENDVVILELLAQAGKEISYPKVKLEVRSSDSRPVKAEFFAATGTLMKIIHYEEYRTINNKILLVKFRMVNALNKAESIIELSNFREQTLDSRFFSREGMKALK